MIIRPYTLKDLPQIQDLLATREMNKSLTGGIPAFGLVAYEGDTLVAAGFIRRVEGFYGMLDSYITNGGASRELRHKALDLITYKLIDIAKHSNEINHLIAFSLHVSIMERAIRHGMTQLPAHSFAILNL